MLLYISATNWTGSYYQGKELGFVQTNHICIIVYDGTTNRTELKVELSNIAVWRDQPKLQFFNTNQFHQYYTNVFLQNLEAIKQ